MTRWDIPTTIFVPLTLAVLALSASQAAAVSENVTNACKNDYLVHCSQHSVGSDGLRRCMRAAGPALSLRCVYALIESGDVSLAEVNAIARRFKKAGKQNPAMTMDIAPAARGKLFTEE